MANNLTWLPRIVTPNEVIMPEQVKRFERRGPFCIFEYRVYGPGIGMWSVSTKFINVRYDRQTGLTDKNGTLVFENDLVEDSEWRDGVVFFRAGVWHVQFNEHSESLYFVLLRGATVCGMVPYGEEARHE